MSVNNLSPINQKIVSSARKNLNKGELHVNLTSKADTVEISSKTNKKIAKYVAIGVAAAAVIGGIVFFATKGKTCLLNLNAKKAQKLAEDVQLQADKIKQEVTELFSNNGMKDGNQVATMIQIDDSTQLMEELANGRKSTFIDGILDSIEVKTKKGSDKYDFIDEVLFQYSKGYEELADGSKKTAKELLFKDGKLYGYLKGCEELADGSKKMAKELWFKDGKLSEYAKNSEELADGSSKAAKELLFEDGKLSGYLKGCEELADGSKKAAKVLVFEDGKLSRYAKNYEELADGSCKVAKELVFEAGKPLKIKIYLYS